MFVCVREDELYFCKAVSFLGIVLKKKWGKKINQNKTPTLGGAAVSSELAL